MDDPNDFLAGRQALRHVGAQRAGPHLGDEVLDDLEVDVRLEQGETDLAHRARDGVLVELAAAADVVQRVLEPVGECIEHGRQCTQAPLRFPDRRRLAQETGGISCTRWRLGSILGQDMAVCLRCGETNPARARFCLACGAPWRSLSPPREMRKTVTVVFTDVIDSTPLGETLDPETYRRVISRYFIEVSRVLEHHGGTVEKFIGDAVMAAFGIPVVHEDDALRAVRAAGEMREALAALNQELRTEYGIELGTRTGINTGEVVAGDPSGATRSSPETPSSSRSASRPRPAPGRS